VGHVSLSPVLPLSSKVADLETAQLTLARDSAARHEALEARLEQVADAQARMQEAAQGEHMRSVHAAAQQVHELQASFGQLQRDGAAAAAAHAAERAQMQQQLAALTIRCDQHAQTVQQLQSLASPLPQQVSTLSASCTQQTSRLAQVDATRAADRDAAHAAVAQVQSRIDELASQLQHHISLCDERASTNAARLRALESATKAAAAQAAAPDAALTGKVNNLFVLFDRLEQSVDGLLKRKAAPPAPASAPSKAASAESDEKCVDVHSGSGVTNVVCSSQCIRLLTHSFLSLPGSVSCVFQSSFDSRRDRHRGCTHHGEQSIECGPA
jgi:hypothetical protein